ncbi:MAG TPA: ion channel [Candidatus Dormibacteraeota bacterium]|nr:ion channel [Candidatus Dormibacteraeota bacterium]
MTASEIVEFVVGALLLLAVSFDLFQSVVLPRPAVHRVQLARLVVRPMWRVWRWIFGRGARVDRSEARLAAFAPLALISLFAIWGFAIIIAYSLMIYGVRDEFRPALNDYVTCFYVSGTTLVPLAFGDFVPEQALARVLIFMESATGVGVAALAITLLFELYGSFRSREESVVALDALAGAPPSAVQLLETAKERGMDDILKETFDEWRTWSAMVLESHLAYPLLVYFRSSHDNEAWINSFGAVMDAAALVISSTDDDAKGAAKLMFTVGNHFVEDITWALRLKTSPDPIIERSEYTAALARLRTAGYKVVDGDASWTKFSHFRSKYASTLNLMAQLLMAPPAQWVGDRSYLPHRQRPRRRRLPARTAPRSAS